MNTEKRIALACFIGAALGAIVALQFNHYLWWLGILIGGAVGYLSYEFRNVCCALKEAWGTTWTELTKERTVTLPIPSWAQVKELLSGCWCFVVPVAGALLYLVLVAVTGLSWGLMLYLLGHSDLAGCMIVGGVSTIPAHIIGFAVLANLNIRPDLNDRREFMSCARDGLITLLYVNSFTTICWWLPVGIVWLGTKMPFAIDFLWKVAKRTFILIHSEIRLLCMTDAMIGALVGYFCGNALVGGIVGAVCGVLNYRLISVRLLKLVKV